MSAAKVVNPLSTPKGHKFECELCGRTALLQCQHCRCTYYCGKDHLQLDWIGIHEKICQLLVPLRSQPLIIGSEEERVRLQANMQKSQRALVELTRLSATRYLVHGNYEHAIPGAVQALRFSLEVYGPGRIELVPCHLLLAEANLGLGRQKQAEEYLSLANWSILKNPDCSNRLKSQLYRNFGKLYASQGKYDEALRQLANDIYFSSLQVGPDHVDTAGGFYYLATVFYLQKRVDCALAMCDKVVDTWYKHCKAHTQAKIAGGGIDPEPLGDAQVMEGLQILSKIVTLREEALGIEHVSAGEACYTLALLYQYAKDNTKARTLMKRALTVYRRDLGDHHKSTQEVLASLEELGVSRVPSRASTAMGGNGEFADVDEDEDEQPVEEGGEEEQVVEEEGELIDNDQGEDLPGEEEQGGENNNAEEEGERGEETAEAELLARGDAGDVGDEEQQQQQQQLEGEADGGAAEQQAQQQGGGEEQQQQQQQQQDAPGETEGGGEQPQPAAPAAAPSEGGDAANTEEPSPAPAPAQEEAVEPEPATTTAAAEAETEAPVEAEPAEAQQVAGEPAPQEEPAEAAAE